MLAQLPAKIPLVAAWLLALGSLILPLMGHTYIADVYQMDPSLRLWELFTTLGALGPFPLVVFAWVTAAFLSFDRVTVELWLNTLRFTLLAIIAWMLVVPTIFGEVNDLGPGPWQFPGFFAILAATALLGVIPHLRKPACQPQPPALAASSAAV